MQTKQAQAKKREDTKRLQSNSLHLETQFGPGLLISNSGGPGKLSLSVSEDSENLEFSAVHQEDSLSNANVSFESNIVENQFDALKLRNIDNALHLHTKTFITRYLQQSKNSSFNSIPHHVHHNLFN